MTHKMTIILYNLHNCFYAFKDCKPDMELSFSTASVPFLIPVLLSLSFLSQEIGLCFDVSNNGWHTFP